MEKFTELKTKRQVLRDIIPLAKPFTLLIEPSSLCNFKCKMCFQTAKEQGEFATKKGNMTLECFNKVMKQAKSWQGEKFKVLKLCIYGEPLVNKDFCEMLKIAQNANIALRTETTTNASLLTEEICTAMVSNKLDYVRVSIYGANETKHKEISNSKIALDKIHENLAMLQRIKKEQGSTKPFVAVKMLDTFDERENSEFKAKFIDVADELYIDMPHNWVSPKEDTFIDKLYDKQIDVISNERYACPMAFTTMAVRSNGDVAPCCIDWFGGTIIGNIYKKSLKEIWTSEELHKIWEIQLTNKKENNISCANCELPSNSHYSIDDIDGLNPSVLNKHFNL